MSPYITYREVNEAGELQYYILQKRFPYYVSRISLNPYEGALLKQSVPGYKMYVVLNGTIEGAVVPSYKDTLQEIEHSLFLMAEWFYENRIRPDEKKYKKYKVNG